jgi:hypothetical protein
MADASPLVPPDVRISRIRRSRILSLQSMHSQSATSKRHQAKFGEVCVVGATFR